MEEVGVAALAASTFLLHGASVHMASGIDSMLSIVPWVVELGLLSRCMRRSFPKVVVVVAALVVVVAVVAVVAGVSRP